MQIAPGEPKHGDHEEHDGAKLPGDTDDHHFQWDHQEDGVEIVKNRQYASFAKQPCSAQAGGSEHGKQYSGRSWG